MSQKHLKDLLKEDQEPFLLKDYIAHKQSLVKNQPPKTQIQVKKPKPISKSSSVFCKNACFLSSQDSPDARKSPLFDFTKTPCKSPNKVFLHVPAKTASILLEAAMKIQKQTKPKTQTKNSGFGLLGSMLKRLANRNRAQKLKTNETEHKKTEQNSGEVVVKEKLTNIVSSSSTTSSSSSSSSCCTCSYNGRLSSSLDLESSSSGRSFNGDEEEPEEDDEGFKFANVLSQKHGDFGLGLSPLSPFRFALSSTPSPELYSPGFPSVINSPVCRKFQDDNEEKYKVHGLGNVQLEKDKHNNEEDKEQTSPVSVLDPLFQDDFDCHPYDDEEDVYHLQSTYALVQRAKHHLLHKLNRFEKLAELDPIELERRLIEDEKEEQRLGQTEYEEYNDESFTFDDQRQVEELINDIIRKSGFQDIKKPGIKRLVSDLIIEENIEEANTVDEHDDEQLIKRICKRLESWEEVEINTIDMMVEMDLRKEIGDWKKPPQQQIDEAGNDVETAIFGVLVDELVQDLSYST